MNKKKDKNLDFYNIHNQSCYGLKEIEDNSIDALITDPPYGIAFLNEPWDKPNKVGVPEPQIWQDCFRVMKPGAHGLVFSFPRVMHRLMVNLEDTGFIIKDVLFWVYFNGMPKTRNIGLEIDKEQGVESETVGYYKYSQGYIKNGAATYKAKEEKAIYQPNSELGKKYNGAGTNIKPFYEPIILIQKPIEGNIIENIKKYETGILNLEDTRIPYAEGESKVGHNPHPKGRVAGNIIANEAFNDKHDKYFEIQKSKLLDDKLIFESKVRQKKEEYNTHPTKKPVRLMEHLVKLLSWEEQTILDPFMGSGSTGVACKLHQRKFIGYELEKKYFEIAEKRLKDTNIQTKTDSNL